MSDGVYRNKFSAWRALLRPGHWVKNGFVLAPLLFSREFNDGEMCLRALGAFGCFSFAASAIYGINDLCDREADRQHPVKKHRPIACGALGAGEVWAVSCVLLVVSVGLAAWLNGVLGIIVGAYAGLNIAYSLGLKHVAILDVMTLAAGFVLRILGGSAAIGAEPSHWLILCTIMISMFLGFAKRRAELVAVQGGQGATRKVLADYSVAFLDQAISMMTGATIICYALYTVDARTVREFGTHAMLLTVPSVIYGFFRYLYLIYHLEGGEDPTRAVVRDVPTIINFVLWVVMAVLVVSYGGRLDLF
jgi:4-hydroxybenzoate polyprenyltransferase